MDLIRALVEARHIGVTTASTFLPHSAPPAAVATSNLRGQQAGAACDSVGTDAQPADAATPPALEHTPSHLSGHDTAQHLPIAALGAASAGNNMDEMQRLASERVALLATGIYSAEDTLIQQIDARMGRLCAKQL